MGLTERLRPRFLDWDRSGDPAHSLFNYRRMWWLVVTLTLAATLLPLLILAGIDYNVTRQAMESETLLRSERLASNTRRTLTYYLEERRAAMNFLVLNNSFRELTDKDYLSLLLAQLKQAFGGFVDLGTIEADGVQRTYVGPYDLQGRDYSQQSWFQQVVEDGVHVSEVFQGFRHSPHLVIAVRRTMADGSFFVLRATLDTARFNNLLASLGSRGDVFVVNEQGVLQTPSRFYGEVLSSVPLDVPAYTEHTEVQEITGPGGEPLTVSYAYIPESPFVLMIVKSRAEMLENWHTARNRLLGFLAASTLGILVVVLGVATFLVDKVYQADQRRAMAVHEMEHSNKLASIGRLAAGVAHEINNPLAIINERAGVIQDIYTFDPAYKEHDKPKEHLVHILRSVERCTAITRRLLSFARHVDSSFDTVLLPEVLDEVIGFLDKEAEYRDIRVERRIPEGLPSIHSDRGKLQQIFLNLINNAFQAMEDGGHLVAGLDEVRDQSGTRWIKAVVADDGKGIPRKDLNRIFEPFFSTKRKKGGSGLGLSITYGLVQEIGGRISVDSEVGVGTTFTIHLPIERPTRTSRDEEHSA
jgi:signal transduction histidine kinase